MLRCSKQHTCPTSRCYAGVLLRCRYFWCSLARAEELEGSLERLKEGVAQAEARKASEDAALEEVFALSRDCSGDFIL